MRPAHTSRRKCAIFERADSSSCEWAFAGSSRLIVHSDQVAREQRSGRFRELGGTSELDIPHSRSHRLGLHTLGRRDQRHSRAHARSISDLLEPLQGKAGHHAMAIALETSM